MSSTLVSQVITIVTSSGATGSALLVLLIVLLAKGSLFTRQQFDRACTDADQALANQQAQYETRITQIIAGKDEAREVVENRLAQVLTDMEALKQALALERASRDALTDKVMQEIVPLVQVANKHFEGIEKLAKDGDPEA